MLFHQRLARARELQRSQRGLPPLDKASEAEASEENAPELGSPELSDVVEKGDVPAMILSAMLTIFLPAAAVLLALTGLACLLFGVF